MTTGNEPIVIGLGCSSAASAGEIVDLVLACLAESDCEASQIVAFATHSRKRGSQALIGAAAKFGAALFFLDDDALAPGIASTCEAAAAAAGPLQLRKRKSRYATCAIARCNSRSALARLAQPARSSAAMAESTLPTSLAGP